MLIVDADDRSAKWVLPRRDLKVGSSHEDGTGGTPGYLAPDAPLHEVFATVVARCHDKELIGMRHDQQSDAFSNVTSPDHEVERSSQAGAGAKSRKRRASSSLRRSR